jgi:ABC-2 type transport system ATP-binding protein
VFLTTHYIEEADQLCDRIAFIVNGRIITIDTPENLKKAIQGTSVIEVIFDSPIHVLDQDELAQYGQTKVQDNTVRIQVTHVSQSLKGISRFADTRGLEIIEMNTVKPSLEDAFVKLTGIQSEAMLLEKEQRGRGM